MKREKVLFIIPVSILLAVIWALGLQTSSLEDRVRALEKRLDNLVKPRVVPVSQ
jgi:hypothetical protein